MNRPQVNVPPKNVERDDPSSPRMPHEHDESHDSQSSAPRSLLKQAHDDIEQGQQDTDRRGAHGFEKPENRILRRNGERARLAQSPARDRKR